MMEAYTADYSPKRNPITEEAAQRCWYETAVRIGAPAEEIDHRFRQWLRACAGLARA